jgi:hypothetical protein
LSSLPFFIGLKAGASAICSLHAALELPAA